MGVAKWGDPIRRRRGEGCPSTWVTGRAETPGRTTQHPNPSSFFARASDARESRTRRGTRHAGCFSRGQEVPMLYQPGDYVYPADLPRRLLCRVQQAETLRLRGGVAQMLRLEPL